MRVGIPRALYYYDYYPLWATFFTCLGAEVVTSRSTSKQTLDSGAKAAVDEACLPVKVFYGHVLELAPEVDMIFLPRLVSVEPRTYTCPKILGLPDMIRQNINPLPRLIDVCVNLRVKQREIYRVVYEVGSLFSRNPVVIWRAYREGLGRLRHYRSLLREGLSPSEAMERISNRESSMNQHAAGEQTPSLRVALLGHPYNIYDRQISFDLLRRLRGWGVEVVTPEMVPEAAREREMERLPKDLFWSPGRRVLGSGLHFINNGGVNGIVQVVSFGCGPDSMVGEILEREARRRKTVPFLTLFMDEHTGEAGVVTRLEAFMDMVKRRAGA